MRLEIEQVIVEFEDYIKLLKLDQSTENVASRLPKLELLKFHGDVLRWQEFWDRFYSSIHVKLIRNVDKLAYLQSCLEGEAKDAVAGLEITNDNYEIALIHFLKDRFGSKAIVVDAHYKELYHMQAKNSSIKESRRKLNEIDRNLRVLQSLGENVIGAYLRKVIIEKFSEDIRMELILKMSKEDESVQCIRKHLEHLINTKMETSHNLVANQYASCSANEIASLSTLLMRQKGRHIKSSTNLKNQRAVQKKGSKRRLVIRRDEHQERKRLAFIFFLADHFNDECKAYNNIKKRRKEKTIKGSLLLMF
ncbi:unnamed protein product [Parnassius apollo]|uniref:(apollo) hypothetical protein n=1 Tax=Parnassius apollo TaxID=110799 RepID=A0A8S3W3Q4_PARAO|nr:unnamed protein product [Parnassius apollo]